QFENVAALWFARFGRNPDLLWLPCESICPPATEHAERHRRGVRIVLLVTGDEHLMAGTEPGLLWLGVELLHLHGPQLITASVGPQANYYEANSQPPRSLSEITQFVNKICVQRTRGARI